MRLFILIRRDPGDSQREFLDWWSERHAELAKVLPGLGRYVLHQVVGGFEGDVDWHGVAEMEFDSLEAAKAAFASPAGRELLDDGATKRGARLMLNTEILRVVREDFDR
jgi:uncharacterized protein (TIGR02118 family)